MRYGCLSFIPFLLRKNLTLTRLFYGALSFHDRTDGLHVVAAADNPSDIIGLAETVRLTYGREHPYNFKLFRIQNERFKHDTNMLP